MHFLCLRKTRGNGRFGAAKPCRPMQPGQSHKTKDAEAHNGRIGAAALPGAQLQSIPLGRCQANFKKVLYLNGLIRQKAGLFSTKHILLTEKYQRMPPVSHASRKIGWISRFSATFSEKMHPTNTEKENTIEKETGTCESRSQRIAATPTRAAVPFSQSDAV